MGFRFFRRLRIAPGISLNFSKSGIAPSFGVRGARLTFGRRGVRRTLGIPGTGLFYTAAGGSRSRKRSRTRRKVRPRRAPTPEPKLGLGFFERLLTPKAERALVDGCKEYVAGHRAKALERLRRATHLADGAFLAGFLALNAGRFDEAADHLRRALTTPRMLGRHFDRYGLKVELALPITEEVTAHIAPGRRGALLGLVEVYQRLGHPRRALEFLKRLRAESPEDVVVRLSMAELTHTAAPRDKRVARQIVQLAGAIENESSLHAALLLYKARALRVLGLDQAARDVLNAALRRKKGRPPQLLHALQYERACVRADLGQTARARREFESLYAACPDYEDVATRLGL